MYIKDMPIVMVSCLIITIILETLISIIIGVRDKKDILNIILVNIFTNPLVTSIPVYFQVQYGMMGRNISLVILEIFAFLSEGFIYYKCLKFRKINGFVLSFLLNLFSYTIGSILNYLFMI